MKSLLWLLLTASLIAANPVYSQTDPIAKKLEKADKLLKSNKAEEAEKMLSSLVKDYPNEGRVWDLLITTQQAVYEIKKNEKSIFDNIQITTKDSSGNELKNDTLGKKLLDLMSALKPSSLYLNHMMNTCRWGCCKTRRAYNASMILRIYRADEKFKDKPVKRDAWAEFQKAEQEFGKRNFNSAAGHYQKAIDLDSSFYKARLYLGDVYYFTKHYDLAITAFKSAVASRPELLEARKYLFDALYNSGAYKQAYDVGIETMAVYPDFVMMAKLERAAAEAGFKCNLNWVEREVLPNSVKEITMEKNDLEWSMTKESPWKYYQEALSKVKTYSNDKGIISSNSFTPHKYLEVYSWDYMLSKAKSDEFAFARKMKEKDLLDAYVFISCFHYDFYEQYQDFVANNSQKIKAYFDMLKQMD